MLVDFLRNNFILSKTKISSDYGSLKTEDKFKKKRNSKRKHK